MDVLSAGEKAEKESGETPNYGVSPLNSLKALGL